MTEPDSGRALPEGGADAGGGAVVGPALLEVRGVSKHFRGLKAVSDATLTVGEGEIVALIGPNGAGKTTLFNLVAGALMPDEGQIRFRGRCIAGRRPDQVCAAGIGRTFQIVKPFADLSVI
ncbi:MAG: ATP-binding cassette domain-containing protein [Lautropia sp.]